jgi:glycyl-tRNA synthetase beta chain
MAEFLLEIGLEEIPARMIAGAQEELGMRVRSLLERKRLIDLTGSNIWDDGRLKVDGNDVIRTYSTPRRLAIHVTGVLLKQDDSEEHVEGPPVAVAYKGGEPTTAAQAFAKKVGVRVEDLLKIQKPKGEYVFARVPRKGGSAVAILAEDLPKEVLSVYWAKNMYWRAGKPERFVRPLRWLVALLDSEVIPLEIAGIRAGNQSRGHRILHGNSLVTVSAPSNYLDALRSAHVEADVAARRNTIRKALDHVTRAIPETPGARWREDEALVETVVHLTEWPTVLYGSFEPEYLTLPEEVLVTVMRDHQKYFAVEDAQGKLAPHFLTVLNTQVDAEGQAIIRHGNERVLRSRFKDAQFFWETDQKIPLVDRVEMLKSVTFQKDLGDYFWKTLENLAIAKRLAKIVSAKGMELDEAVLCKAVELAKTDLTAELVKEFTELQGVIGGLYARAQGLGEAVCESIYWQYSPAGLEDPIPPSSEGQIFGIADRIQTIFAMFGIELIPTGSKDPFALRRAANAIIKILAESSLPMTIRDVASAACEPITRTAAYGTAPLVIENVISFLAERLNFYLKDVRGFTYDVVNAVLAAGAEDVRDAIARAEALTSVRGSEDFLAISAAFKRIKNILRQAAEKGDTPGTVAESSLTQPEERILLAASSELSVKVADLRQQHDYTAALEAIATLRPTVDAFFDKVMVMTPEPELRAARLALIQSVLDGFSGIADFSEIVVA